jgi:hypothetical protein
VNHPVVVGILEGAGGLGGNPECILHWQLRLASQTVTETLPFDEGHGEPELPSRFPRVVNGEDMRVLQAGCEPNFSLETLRAECRSQLGMQHLKSHRSVVPPVMSEVDCCHPPAAELALDAIAVG